MKHSERFLAIVNDAKSRIRECTVEEVAAKRAGGDTFHLVDVREACEWARGHWPGASYLGSWGM